MELETSRSSGEFAEVIRSGNNLLEALLPTPKGYGVQVESRWRLLDFDRAQAGHDQSLGQAVANHLLLTGSISQVTAGLDVIVDFRRDRFGEHSLGSLAKDVSQNFETRDWHGDDGLRNVVHGGEILAVPTFTASFNHPVHRI